MKRRMTSVTALLLVFSLVLLFPLALELYLQTTRKAHEIRDEWERNVRRKVNQFDVNYQNTPGINWDEYRLQLLYDVNRREDVPMESAAVFFENGKPVTRKHSYVSLEYFTDKWWYSQGVEVLTQAETDKPLLILNRFPDDAFIILSEFATLSLDLEAVLEEGHPLMQQIIEDGGLNADIIRMTGYAYHPEGVMWVDDFIPTAISTFNMTDPSVYAGKPLGQWDAEGALLWEDIYQVSPDSPVMDQIESRLGAEAELVEIFTLGGLLYNPEGPFENSYVQMDPELQQMLLHRNDSPYNTLRETVIIESKTGVDEEGNCHELWVAMRCYPLREAIKQLWYVYLLTFALFMGQILLLRVLLERWLEKPLQQIIESSQNNMAPIRNPYWARFTDVIQVQQGYLSAQQELQTLRQENTRLQTALEYAQNAEINRRQMVSNITHELKTPLAVIHSYCEGLQAGIAPEKQRKYLDVITDEADRMDAMVLEMLDLSRLEAGKVKLARDSVELQSLTRSILEKLQPLLEAKELTLEYALNFPAHLVADESRLTQVIINLASNAIKYSPQGGKVLISIFQRHGFTHFSIENESAPLSQEALDKIWESFYRTEQSRTTKGTGLGLSICKAIIELHGSSCHVHNTSTGVEFSFMIP